MLVVLALLNSGAVRLVLLVYSILLGGNAKLGFSLHVKTGRL